MHQRLLLVGWEAADWRILHPLIDAGRLPALQSIVEGGASGTLLSGQPLVPAAQWTSLVTGKRPWQHGVCHQFEFDPATRRPAPISAKSRQAAALWEMLGREGKQSLLVGWPGTHGTRCEQATIVSNRFAEPTAGPGVKPWPPALPGTYWPADAGPRLDASRVSPEDIGADLIAHFVPDWRKLDQKRDRRLGHLRVFLAADLSHHAAIMELLPTREWDFAAVHFPALGGISAVFLPYRAPRRDWVPQAEFELYQHVLESACQVLDRMLQSLIQAAGPDTAIVLASAHGVDQNLPAHYLRTRDNSGWKTPYGILAVRGPGFRPDSLVMGATIHDVAPTILTWFGLPIGDDMEGRVLIESFEATPMVGRIASWEASAKPAALSQTPLVPLDEHSEAQRLRLESDWNRALSTLDGAHYAEALPLLTQLFRAFPERSDFAQALFQCQLTLKQTDEAAVTLELLLEATPPGLERLLPQLDLCLAQGRRQPARELVEQIQKLNPTEPEALRRLGMSLWRLRDWPALARLARQVIERDENQPLAWLGLAEASLRLNQPAAAIEAAQRAIRLNYFQPQAHLVLARAWLNQGQWAQAREAMQTVLRLQPQNRAAETYSRRTGLSGA